MVFHNFILIVVTVLSIVNLYIKKTFINARRLFGTPFNYIPQNYRSYQVGLSMEWKPIFAQSTGPVIICFPWRQILVFYQLIEISVLIWLSTVTGRNLMKNNGHPSRPISILPVFCTVPVDMYAGIYLCVYLCDQSYQGNRIRADNYSIHSL
jgi:hypothetical protein